MGSDFDAEDQWLENCTYRQTYGIAHGLEVEHRQGPRWREEPTWILAEVVRQLSPLGEELVPLVLDLVREAVGDAVARRRPRC
jgi:hypothetical protein